MLMTQPQPAKSDLNSPILSVLLPVRQRPLFLKRTISSILFQSFRNWELVVLLDRDDGSNREIISKLITENDVVFIDVDILRDGFAHALNLGVVFCRGEYIARCDDDDLSVATRFEEQVCHLENDPSAVLVTGWATVVDKEGRVKRKIDQPLDSTRIKHALCRTNIIPHSATTFKRGEFNKVGGYTLGLDGCEDYELWLRLALNGELKSTGTILISYLDNPEGMSRWFLARHHFEALRTAQRNLYKYLEVPISKRELSVFIFKLRQIASQLLHKFSL
jgi:glycosyltransferase involved in cell wall biosynthesis